MAYKEKTIFGMRVRPVPDDGTTTNCAICALNEKCHFTCAFCWGYGGRVHFDLVNDKSK